VQLAEKYATLAQDARSNKDRVIVEGLLQHAEHYMRIVSEANEAQAKQREQSEANRRQNNEQMADRNDAPQVNGADTAVEQPVSANASVSAEQPDIDAAGAGDQPAVDESVPVQETPTPVRRQRRSTGQRRSRVAAKTADKAEAMEKAPAPAPEAPAEEPAEIPAEIPVATEPSE